MDIKGLKKLPNGYGGFGSCYILDNDTLYKEFYRQKNGSYPFTEENYEKTLGLENDSFVFPKQLDVENGFVKGYTMDFIHAKDLNQVDFNFSITDFIYALDKLKQGLYEVTEEGILINDVNSKNILYDGEKMHIIDTDLYVPKEKMGIDPYEFNEDYLTSYLYYYFTQEKNRHSMEELINNNDFLRAIDKDMKKDASISELKDFLFELRDYVSSLIDKDIDNFTDLYQTISQIR